MQIFANNQLDGPALLNVTKMALRLELKIKSLGEGSEDCARAVAFSPPPPLVVMCPRQGRDLASGHPRPRAVQGQSCPE